MNLITFMTVCMSFLLIGERCRGLFISTLRQCRAVRVWSLDASQLWDKVLLGELHWQSAAWTL